MIDIKLESSVIPVRIGKNEFEFSVSDEAVLARVPKSKEVMKKIEQHAKSIDSAIDSASEKQQLERTKSVLKEYFDSLLGDGAFSKIYKECQSTLAIIKIVLPLSEKIEEEINKYQLSDLKSKHLG